MAMRAAGKTFAHLTAAHSINMEQNHAREGRNIPETVDRCRPALKSVLAHFRRKQKQKSPAINCTT
jgi:hypothetical protein